MGRIFIFFLLTLALLGIFRKSLAEPGSHGFFRFFAFEFLLALLLYNSPHWFEEPYSWYQTISWLFLLISICLALAGFLLLRHSGGSRPRQGVASNFAFENTAHLVTHGVYRSIRHPLYSSLMFLAWGAFFKLPSWFGVLLALLASGSLYMTARVEEGENMMAFGDAYERYMTTTRMFIPFIF